MGVDVELGRTRKADLSNSQETVGDSRVTSDTTVTTPQKQGDLLSTDEARVTQDDDGAAQEYPRKDAGDDGDDKIPSCSEWTDPNDLLDEAAEDQEAEPW